MLKERGQTEPGLVAFYVIRPGNGAALFFQPRSTYGLSPHGVDKREVTLRDSPADGPSVAQMRDCLPLDPADGTSLVLHQ